MATDAEEAVAISSPETTASEKEANVVVVSSEEEKLVEEQPSSSICETTTEEGDDDDDYFADVGFMFEANQPTRVEHFAWDIAMDAADTGDTGDTGTAGGVEERPGDRRSRKRVTVAVRVADDEPGAVQSGQYLWPGAFLLADYLVHHYHPHHRHDVTSVVELGAGCALASLTALQLWSDTLHCLVVTDHDPGTLIRARDNLETTVQHIIVGGGPYHDDNDDYENENANSDDNDGKDDQDDDPDDEYLNAAINSVASTPVLFETLEWGDDTAAYDILQHKMGEHIVGCYAEVAAFVDVVLGSDLIYCADVVEPLLQTAAQLIGSTGCFLLSQSFVYEATTEAAMDRACESLGLQRIMLVDENNGARRIQEFRAAVLPAATSSDREELVAE